MVEKKNDGRKNQGFGQGMSEKEKEEARRKGGEHSRSGSRPNKTS